MKIPIIKLGKIVVNSIFPFFEKSKALKLIKEDMLEVSDDLLAQLYDAVKPAFISDDRKTILEQLEKAPDSSVWQAATNAAITEELKKNGVIYKKLEEIVTQIDKKYASKVTNIVKDLEGNENEIIQGTNTNPDSETTNTIEKVKGNKNKIVQG